MKLPDRVKPLLDRLRAFSRSSELASFRREARRRFFGEYVDPEPDEEEHYEDYLLHEYRDEHGRRLIEHFLSARGDGLDEAEREAFRSMERSLFALFKVESIQPDEGLQLLRVGTAERFSVVEITASHTVEKGAGILARVIPYRGHHELSSVVLSYPPEACYGLERMIGRHGDQALADLADPLKVRELCDKVRKDGTRRPPPANRFEAELMAADLFARLRFTLTVEEVQERFQSMASCMDLFNDQETLPSFETEAHFRAFAEAVRNLWNHTPRDDLGGSTPTEKHSRAIEEGQYSPPEHLIHDFMRQTAAELDHEILDNEDRRRAALVQAFSRWLVTEQKELDGLSPIEAYGMGRAAPLPREDELPDADVPLWPRERVERWLADEGRTPEARIWALEWIRHRDYEIPSEKIFPLLSVEDPRTLREALGLLSSVRSSERREAAQIVACRLQEFEELDKDLLIAGIDLVADLDPASHWEAITRYLDSDSARVRRAAARRVAEAAPSRIGELLVPRIGRRDIPIEEMLKLVGGVIESEDVDAISRAAKLLLERLESDADLDIVDLPYCLSRWDPDSDLAYRVGESLYFDPYDLDGEPRAVPDHDERARVFCLSADPSAKRRSHEYFLPNRDRIFELADEIEDEDLAVLLRELVHRVTDDAIGEHPAFAGPGRALLAFVDVVTDPDGFPCLSEHYREPILTFSGVALALGLRGRMPSDPEPILLPESLDTALALERCRVDDAWLQSDLISVLAPKLPEGPLERLGESGDELVRWNVLVLLAAKDPVQHLNRALDESSILRAPDALRAACRVRGDAVLPVAVGRALRSSGSHIWSLVCLTIESLATRRALAYFARYFDLLAIGPEAISANRVVTMATAAGETALAQKVLDEIEAGNLNLAAPADREDDLERFTRQVSVLIEVSGLDGDPGVIVEGGVERFRERKSEDEEDEYDHFEDVHREYSEPPIAELDSHHRESEDVGSRIDPVEPIRRNAPKTGRNDPCPCGSGRKYKKCCGKG